MRLKVLSVFAGMAILAGVLWLNAADLRSAGRILARVPSGVAISVAIHLPQLAFTALAWRSLLPDAMRPPLTTMIELRLVRESLNALIPAGAIVGQTFAAQRLSRTGVTSSIAGATGTVDMTVEGATQAFITLVGLVLLLSAKNSAKMGWFALPGMALSVLAIVAMIAVQRHLPLRTIEALGTKYPTIAGVGAWLAGLQHGIRRLHADYITLARAAGWHLSAWVLGAVEVSWVLSLLGRPINLADGLVVESLTQALRSAAFFVPGALGIQEGAIVAACALVGVPGDAALTLALVRRGREILLGLLGLVALRRRRSPPIGHSPR